MLVMSVLFVCIGVPSEALLYTRDWWHPETITGTLIGIEDVIAATWDLPHLSGLLPLGIPIEDLPWYVYTAALWGAYYKFATGQRVVAYASMRSSSRSSSRSTRRSTSSLI